MLALRCNKEEYTEAKSPFIGSIIVAALGQAGPRTAQQRVTPDGRRSRSERLPVNTNVRPQSESHGMHDVVRLLRGLLVCTLSMITSALGTIQDGTQPKPAVPLEPLAASLEAFRTHDIVALGEGAHGTEQAHAFRLALIRDARIASAVNDVVVECGNARYQDVMDRFATHTERRVIQSRSVAASTVWNAGLEHQVLSYSFRRAYATL